MVMVNLIWFTISWYMYRQIYFSTRTDHGPDKLIRIRSVYIPGSSIKKHASLLNPDPKIVPG